MKTYDEDREDRTPGRRSRIGDAIAVFGGADFLSKLSAYSEDHVFHLSKRWRITIKGGQRTGGNNAAGPEAPISPQFKLSSGAEQSIFFSLLLELFDWLLDADQLELALSLRIFQLADWLTACMCMRASDWLLGLGRVLHYSTDIS